MILHQNNLPDESCQNQSRVEDLANDYEYDFTVLKHY